VCVFVSVLGTLNLLVIDIYGSVYSVNNN